MRKRVLSAILCLCVAFGMAGGPMVASAAYDGNGEVGLMWINTNKIALDMSYSGGKITWTGSVQGNANATKVTATYTISKKNSNGTYSVVYTSSTYSANANKLSSTGTYTTGKGTYKLEVSATVVVNGVSEKVSDSLVKTF